MTNESVRTSLYLSKKSYEELQTLCKLWGENNSNVIARLIAAEIMRLDVDKK